ncbi:MAG TPA: aminoglycoside phosphotransferase family protein [Alphaproteobacteria bacterium]
MDELPWGEDRNARLRRVDWRFLLPSPAPNRSICLAGGRLGDTVASISGETGTDLNLRDACDLVVAVDPDVSTLRAARNALAPGAWCYMEWHAAGPRRVRGMLRAAGFDDVACYWPWPSPARARFWIPLDRWGAPRHFRHLQQGGRTLVRRAGRAARRILWPVAGWAQLLRPVCAIARKPPASTLDASAGRRALLERVREGWPTWGLGPAPRHFSCLLVTEGRRSISKCVAQVFADSDPRPRLAIKLPRVPEAVPALAREAAVLRTLHARHPGAFPGIPRVVFEEKGSAGTLLGETALPGTPLNAIVRRGNYRDLALKATTWLADFARRTARPPSADWRERIAVPALADFTDAFGAVADDGLLRRTRAAIALLGPLPIVAEQRDFSPWNVLIDSRGELIVLDWESAELDGLPGLDLIYFLTYLACELDRVPYDTASDRLRESYRRALDPASFTGQVRAECLARYAERLGLDAATLPSLAALAWLIHSRSDYRQLAAEAGGSPDRTALGRSVFLAFWEEEVRSASWTTRASVSACQARKPLPQPVGQPACTTRS